MTARPFTSTLRTAALSAVFCAGGLLQAPAQAGLVSGSWDPAFGLALPDLSWSVHAELLVPDNACTDLSGTLSTAPGAGACADAKLLGVFLRLYDTASGTPDWTTPGAYTSSLFDAAAYALCDNSVQLDPAFTSRCGGNFGSGFFDLQALRIEGGSVVGLDASVLSLFQTAVVIGGVPASLPTSAQSRLFSLGFTTSGPQLTCTNCPGGPVLSQTDDLRQFLITYTSDDTTAPKFRDANGNALGVRLDETGRVVGRSTSIDGALQPVPEPGSLGLVAAALAAAALLRRRRGRG
jgi:hypothetical protein